MRADVDGREPRLRRDRGHQADAEEHGIGRIGELEHEGITDLFDDPATM
jgi:hypothetical protein